MWPDSGVRMGVGGPHSILQGSRVPWHSTGLKVFSSGIQRSKGLWIGAGVQAGKGREGLWGSSLDWERMSKDFSLLLTPLTVSSFRRKGLRGGWEQGPLETKNCQNSRGGFSSTESVKTQTLLHPPSLLHFPWRLFFHRLESGVTPVDRPQIRPSFLPHTRISCSLTFHQQQKQPSKSLILW